jgi:hypothetical protein
MVPGAFSAVGCMMLLDWISTFQTMINRLNHIDDCNAGPNLSSDSSATGNRE